MQSKFSFSNFIDEMEEFLNQNSEKSFVIQNGEGAVMLSAPHGVSQVRLGRRKFAEPSSLAFMLEIAKRTGAPFIAKTKNCDDDANFDENCAYKKELKNFIQKNNIQFLLDFHGLNKKRGIDINFGTNFGRNINANKKLFDDLCKEVENAGFIVSIDNPFWAGTQTVAGSISSQTEIWTLQVEINYKFTFDELFVTKLQILLDIFENFIKKINKK